MSNFVTLGTHDQPFPRALAVVDEVSRAGPVLVQHGETPPDPLIPGATWVAYLDWTELHAELAAADVVICHAGVGSTISALRAGKLPILLPRLSAYGEHVDDHQLQLAGRFEAAGLALVYRAPGPIAPLIERARVGVVPGATLGDGRLRGAVAAAAGVGGPEPTRQRGARTRRRLTDWSTLRGGEAAGRRRTGF